MTFVGLDVLSEKTWLRSFQYRIGRRVKMLQIVPLRQFGAKTLIKIKRQCLVPIFMDFVYRKVSTNCICFLKAALKKSLMENFIFCAVIIILSVEVVSDFYAFTP